MGEQCEGRHGEDTDQGEEAGLGSDGGRESPESSASRQPPGDDNRRQEGHEDTEAAP
mgnify:FL=1